MTIMQSRLLHRLIAYEADFNTATELLLHCSSFNNTDMPSSQHHKPNQVIGDDKPIFF